MTGKERREQLLDIGRRLFAERGLDGTSIEEIAAQAGVSKPVVYEHFGGKEGLYAVVVDREVERFLTMATTLLEGEDTMAKFEIGRGRTAALHPGATPTASASWCATPTPPPVPARSPA